MFGREMARSGAAPGVLRASLAFFGVYLAIAGGIRAFSGVSWRSRASPGVPVCRRRSRNSLKLQAFLVRDGDGDGDGDGEVDGDLGDGPRATSRDNRQREPLPVDWIWPPRRVKGRIHDEKDPIDFAL